jgi:hypothetical protein
MIFLVVIASLNSQDLEKVFQIGKSSSKLLLQTLGKNLKQHMKKDGIKGAVNFCSENALAITYEVSEKLGENISVKRISTKYRNPYNKPTKTEAKILFQLENNKFPILTKVKDGEYKFYKPLRISKPICLKCHGKGVDMPEIARRTLHHLYPNDKATGYEFGDLRGAIVVTIKTEEKK